jgi:hypothetical protein
VIGVDESGSGVRTVAQPTQLDLGVSVGEPPAVGSVAQSRARRDHGHVSERSVIVVGLSIAVLGGCGTTKSTPSDATGTFSALNGDYRVIWSEKELIAAGASPTYAHNNFGTVTMKLRNGGYTFREKAQGKDLGCKGPYTINGQSLYLDFRVAGCMGEVTARWARSNGELRLRLLRGTDRGDRVLFGGKPWKKIA